MYYARRTENVKSAYWKSGWPTNGKNRDSDTRLGLFEAIRRKLR